MNREIKFRGKCSHSDEWCFGSLVDYGDGEMEIQGFGVFCEGIEDWKEIKICPDTVGQFTGLYDANGKEIYEGDLLQTPEQDIMLVEWQDAKLITKCVRPHDPRYVNSLTYAYPVSVVIGNIHDTPEFLKSK